VPSAETVAYRLPSGLNAGWDYELNISATTHFCGYLAFFHIHNVSSDSAIVNTDVATPMYFGVQGPTRRILLLQGNTSGVAVVSWDRGEDASETENPSKESPTICKVNVFSESVNAKLSRSTRFDAQQPITIGELLEEFQSRADVKFSCNQDVANILIVSKESTGSILNVLEEVLVRHKLTIVPQTDESIAIMKSPQLGQLLPNAKSLHLRAKRERPSLNRLQ
jgi:hypothetical protein